MGFLVPVVRMRRRVKAMMVWVSHLSPCLEDERRSLLHLLFSIAFPLRPEMREEKVSLWFASIMMLGVAESEDKRPLGCRMSGCLHLAPAVSGNRQGYSKPQSRIHDKIIRACPWRVGVIIPHL